MILVIIAFGFLVFVHEASHFIVAKRMGVTVEVFSIGFGPKIFSFKRSGTEYKISLIPLGGYVKMAGENPREDLKGEKNEFLSQPPGRRSLIVLGGPLGNYILAFILFFILYSSGLPTAGTTIGDFKEGYPAQSSGLKIGDKIISVDSEEVKNWEDLIAEVHPRPNQDLKITVKRDQYEFSYTVKTKDNEILDLNGQKKVIGLLGILPDDRDVFIKKYGPYESLRESAVTVFNVSANTLRAILNIVIGRLSLKDSVTGPVGIVHISSKMADMGISYLLSLMALINVSLAIFNLLPIPVLDGGHLLFILMEKIRRKPVSIIVQERFTQIGMGLLLSLFLYLTYFDLMRVFFK
ncbi:MAG: RIP metalloprotease RseP [Candidatus Kaelpia aquatica]|nr:RIP metalloprotease RseP [Candidatus Kaelpia aquatica]